MGEVRTMVTVTEGVYRISLDNQLFLTVTFDNRLGLLPADSSNLNNWEIRRSDKGNYTIKRAGIDQYAGYGDTAEPFEPIRLSTQPCEWTITDGDGDRENAVVIGVPASVTKGEELTLGIAPMRIYPPLVALSPLYPLDRPWTLQPVSRST